jgi:hypothetical protein
MIYDLEEAIEFLFYDEEINSIKIFFFFLWKIFDFFLFFLLDKV